MRLHTYLYTASVALWSSTNAAPASPIPNEYEQPDGTLTPLLYLNGDERYAWLSNEDGYTVMKDMESGYFVYAQLDSSSSSSSSKLIPTDVSVNEEAPAGLEPNLMEAEDGRSNDDSNDDSNDRSNRQLRGTPATATATRSLAGRPKGLHLCESVQQATAKNPCALKQLVLLVRFADHDDRVLPSPEEIDVLFNHNGPTGNSTARTGSISDVYRANSFDTFVVDSHITPWQRISFTEKQCSDGNRGFNHDVTRACWKMAMLQYYDSLSSSSSSNNNNIDEALLAKFDDNKDGFFDGLAIVHSGVAAEFNKDDCETGAHYTNRIWSHAVPKVTRFNFLADTIVPINVGRFYVFSGIYGHCVNNAGKWETARIAVATHEGGHFLGLPDMFGHANSNGIGNYGFMASMYGWDKTGFYPGMMSAFSRYLLEWVEVVDITYSQTVTVMAACDSDRVYRIRHRMARDTNGGTEFLLLENRNGCGFDLQFQNRDNNREGIAIWHVDHTNLAGVHTGSGHEKINYKTTRIPQVDSDWPQIHSRVSVLQGDGNHDLERANNQGDGTDLFRVEAGNPNVAHTISNDGTIMNNGQPGSTPYPNTKSIATGVEQDTCITIEVLDQPGYNMQVKITLCDEDGNIITEPPEEVVIVNEGDGDDGDVTAANDNDNGIPSTFACDNLPQHVFQIPGDGGWLLLRECQFITTSSNPTNICNEVDHLRSPQQVYQTCQNECSMITRCGQATSPPVVAATSNPTRSPTRNPTKSPSASPVTAAPTRSPTRSPTLSPTKADTSAPTNSPTRSPTTTSPTERAVVEPEFECLESSSSLLFETTSATGAMTSTECRFLPSQTDMEALCGQENFLDSPNEVYKTCQIECSMFTGCTSPDPAATTSNPTRGPTASPTNRITATPTQLPTKAPTTSAPTLNPTQAPVVPPTRPPTTNSPTRAPTKNPTKSPTVSPTQGSLYPCDNSPRTIFQIPGDDGWLSNLECQSITGNADPASVCNKFDMLRNKMVFETCQIECPMITGC